VELATDLITRARAGDRSAQQSFVEAYQQRVYAVCAALAPGHAEDLAQEALLRALLSLGRFELNGPARLGTFVLRIARNLCIDQLRSTKRRGPHDADVDQLVGGGSADHHLAAARDAERVRIAVLALPPDQRAAVVLRMWGELDYAEIASIENVPIGTIRSRLSRARDELRRMLAATDVTEISHAG
jgi:RNA polymerase sigma-70 factor (ECF subfamily)